MQHGGSISYGPNAHKVQVPKMQRRISCPEGTNAKKAQTLMWPEDGKGCGLGFFPVNHGQDSLALSRNKTCIMAMAWDILSQRKKLTLLNQT